MFVGIDISKDHLDVHPRPTGEADRGASTDDGIAALVARLTAAGPALVVPEATGGSGHPAAAAPAAAGLPVAVVNPRQARDFARSIGRPAKTDRTPPPWPTSPGR